MKKKLWIIVLATVVALILLLVIAVGIMLHKGYGASVGKYLESKDGKAMLVSGNSPTVMSNRTNRDIFDDLDVGDEIFVIHTGIAESYPGQMGAYAVIKLKDGSAEDVPDAVISELKYLGWLEPEVSDATGFYGGMLYLKLGEETLIYESYEASPEMLNADVLLDSFYTETSVEGIIWEIYSTKEHPDLSVVLAISGTNSTWVFRRSQ